MGRWVHPISGRLVPLATITVMLVATLGAPSAAQPSACDLVAPWELSEATGAAIGPGETTGTTCTWRTETRDGSLLTISLDVSAQPSVVTVETDSPSIDGAAISSAIAALADERVASGDVAPLEPPVAVGGVEQPDLCALFPADVIAAMVGVEVKPYGSQGTSACGYLADEPGRGSIDVLVAFDNGSLADIPQDWPDAIEAQVAGLPALDYGWDLGITRTAYLSVETDAGLLTAKVTYDRDDLDAAEMALELVEAVLESMGHAVS